MTNQNKTPKHAAVKKEKQYKDVSLIYTPSEIISPSTTSRKKVLKFFTDLTVIILGGILLAVLVKTFLIRSFYIPSESMEPTLMIDDRVIVEQISPKIGTIKKGDIIVFKDNQGWISDGDKNKPTVEDLIAGFFTLTEKPEDQYLIKRVIGVAGDTVECCNDVGQLMVNGEPQREPYLTSYMTSSIEKFKTTVPENSVWVMGDNRLNSADSRYHTDKNGGFISTEDIVGRVTMKVFPIDRMSFY